MINWKDNYWIKEPSKPISDTRAKVYYYKSYAEDRMYLHSSSSLEDAFSYVISHSKGIYRQYGGTGDLIIEYKDWKYYHLGSPDRETYDNFSERVKGQYNRDELFGFYEPGNPLLVDKSDETVWVNSRGKMVEAWI
jgi:hypothetical protein